MRGSLWVSTPYVDYELTIVSIETPPRIRKGGVFKQILESTEVSSWIR